MKPLRYSFAHQFVGFVVAALMPVVLVAFICIPFILGGHPGEPRASVPQMSESRGLNSCRGSVPMRIDSNQTTRMRDC